MKRIFILFITVFVPLFQVGAQLQHSITQEELELECLNQYEKEKNPRCITALPADEENEFLYGSRIQRAVTLLESSNERKKQPVSILIYGQSITGSQIFTEELQKYLQERYPYAIINLENRSIGGFTGERLVRTSSHDVYYSCPDLIIFHVYGGEEHGYLETIFSNIRRYTAADIIILNHIINGDSIIKFDESSYKYMQYIANKYDCELVDLTKSWSRYLTDNNLKVTDLLRDITHPNRNGNKLLVQLIGKHIRKNMFFPSDWYKRVKTYYVNTANDTEVNNPMRFDKGEWKKIENVYCGEDPHKTLTLNFIGNRVDIIAAYLSDGNKLGSAKIMIDGQPVSRNKSLYAITRPSAGPGTWWPLVKRVGHYANLVDETWTMVVNGVNSDSTVWTFSVSGSKTGFDGQGRSDELFVSKSGRVVIEKDDYSFLDIKNSFGVVTKPGFKVTWNVVPLFKDLYESPKIEDKAKVYKETVVQALSNGRHTLQIVPCGNGLVPIEAIEVYCPPVD